MSTSRISKPARHSNSVIRPSPSTSISSKTELARAAMRKSHNVQLPLEEVEVEAKAPCVVSAKGAVDVDAAAEDAGSAAARLGTCAGAEEDWTHPTYP